MKQGLYIVIERICPDEQSYRLKIDEQVERFHRAQSLFGYIMAVKTQDKKQPSKEINIIYLLIF